MRLRKTIKLILPLVILGGAAFVAYSIMQNAPEAKRRPASQAPQMTVETMQLSLQPYQVKVGSFGTVRPRTKSLLVAQASGQITSLSENFRDGGFFEKGDLLLTLDDRDHRADVKIARANLNEAKQQLVEEKAKAAQARADWNRVGKQGKPNDLVLRKPQLEAAKARVMSLEAQLAKARLTLARTKIVAPYAGRVLSKKVDLGQVISSNSQLAEIYAVDYVEIRLPIRNQDLPFLHLPEQFRGNTTSQTPETRVLLSSAMSGQTWQARLVRTEGAIDEQSQQLYVVAQVDDPFGLQQAKQTPIKIGQYVNAELDGMTINDSLIIPTKSIYQGSYVFVVEDGKLMRRTVQIAWKNKHEAVIESGLNAGDQLVVSALGPVSSGTRVTIAGEGDER